VKFKRLEINGFKSFADKLEVKFGKGITAIVGPNGCGKSNVADSIRWVLGEQSAKLLRGSSMVDVIFNGTEKRKSLSYCEVALVFDNKEGLFPSLAYDEVVISRKLYRSGESEYALNRSACRLKDIVDLLRDSGMGREGYSIIGQGRIDQMLSAKPEDRRAIFEEAAGISKFKARKVDAERKLARANDNLSRVTDILGELGRQLEPLSKQAEAARKYMDLRERLRHFEINTYIYQYDSASEAKAAIDERLNVVIAEFDKVQKDFDLAGAEYNEAMSKLNGLDATIEDLWNQKLQLTVGIEKYTGEVKILAERAAAQAEQAEYLSREIARLEAERNQALEYLSQNAKVVESKKEQLEKRKTELEQITKVYIDFAEKLAVGEGEEESNRQAIMEAMDKLADIKANASSLTAEKKALAERHEDVQRRIISISEKASEESSKVAERAKYIDGLQNAKADLMRVSTEAADKHNEIASSISEIASRIDKLNTALIAHEARQKVLAEMHLAYEGFGAAVKKLMTDAREDQALRGLMEGVIAQLINVPQKYEAAIEAALGAAVTNIVTRTEEDAKSLIGYLKEKRYGRITFLPISAARGRSLDRDETAYCIGDKIYGAADKLVTCDSKYANIISGLLGRTVVVDDLDTAIALARKSKYSFRIVTLDGDLVTPGGAMTGGSRKSDVANLLGHERELKELDASIKDASKNMELLTGEREKKAEMQEELSGKIKSLNGKIHTADVEIASEKAGLEKIEASLEDLLKEIEVLQGELKLIGERTGAIDGDLGSVGELEAIIAGKKAEASQAQGEQKNRFDEIKKGRDLALEQMTSAKIAVAELDAEISTLAVESDRLSSTATNIGKQIDSDKALAESAKEAAANIKKQIERMTSPERADDKQKVEQIVAKLDNLDNYKKQLQARVAELDEGRTALITAMQSLTEKKSREEMLLVKVDTDIATLEERVMQEYELDYTACLEFKEEGYDITAGAEETDRLRRQIKNLGHVNIDAIEQSKECFERYNEMDVQREDLVKGINDLNNIIGGLSKEMVERFAREFEKIQTGFTATFKELFNGGHAELVLQEGEDMLEAGIEIIAQPPEKKLQSISLLSGGERALTAIAILFAILRMRPMPFCVLDEIEAALDDANAGRFAKYLHRFSSNTQIIVITHRKPTMEMADGLYGVTMEEKGVSKIVSVKLSEAVSHAGEDTMGA